VPEDQILTSGSCDPVEMRELKAVFDQGRLIAMPTETVYGLAAPVNRPDLIERIFEIKGRPANNPLIVHVANIDQARRCVDHWPALADHLAREFWPGPLTLVLQRSSLICDRVTAGQHSVALRMPDHPMALALINALDCPLVAPSANRFTRLSPTSAADVAKVFDEQDVLVLDGGPCQVGIESSILALDESSKTVRLLRPGQIDRATIEQSLLPGWQLLRSDGAQTDQPPQAPGSTLVHYRPDKPLRVTLISDATKRRVLETSLREDPSSCLVELGDQADSAARSLYGALRDADARSGRFIDIVILASWQEESQWEGVVNRLKKAASDWQDLSG